jgi:hypothetical protein
VSVTRYDGERRRHLTAPHSLFKLCAKFSSVDGDTWAPYIGGSTHDIWRSWRLGTPLATRASLQSPQSLPWERRDILVCPSRVFFYSRMSQVACDETSIQRLRSRISLAHGRVVTSSSKLIPSSSLLPLPKTLRAIIPIKWLSSIVDKYLLGSSLSRAHEKCSVEAARGRLLERRGPDVIVRVAEAFGLHGGGPRQRICGMRSSKGLTNALQNMAGINFVSR